ncbi:hypothetical protein BD410DRAFT_785592 [Rickenella mellea]|uniref:Expansin-like EG45 domain-containing protein n=1 Tax=Rickenella mellea TaxID=50990 RepID=A0A4Y7QCB2_9AGAM|nr:hypothetical protein BD410DRAFT_785592 [Rickenella mellea]
MFAVAIISSVAYFLAALPAAYAASGVSTFNNYGSQSGVACSGYSPNNSQGNGIYAAAMSDLSPLWTGARCSGSMDASKCNGKGSCTNCAGPSCSGEGVCGKCFNVKCTGSLDGESGNKCSGKTIKVKIVDACPATHPENYCKIPQFGGTINPKEACESSGTNALDIATTARSALSSYSGNLYIDIEATSC